MTGLPISPARADVHLDRIRTVAETPGLVAFWDFDRAENGVWISHHDPASANRSYPLRLRRIGDPKVYAPADWPYDDEESRLEIDTGGPLGKAIRFHQGHIYGEVRRADFDGAPLDIHGKRPFTLIAWTKFTGKRHLVTGIWDEGGWDKYSGRRQVALFAGLFGQKGVIAHVSATGASSFPQSVAKGSQYARIRAIDGRPFTDGEWVAMAMTYDPDTEEVTAWLNGRKTPLNLTDPVEQSVYGFEQPKPANPYRFTLPIFSPRAFALKYNGYDAADSGICEHRLRVDLDARTLIYEQDRTGGIEPPRFRIFFDLERKGRSLLGAGPVAMEGVHGETAAIPGAVKFKIGDEIRTRLEVLRDGKWERVGTEVVTRIREGAPFTFGRALGLGSEKLEEGSQLFLDGVAVFDRVLAEQELGSLSFTEENS